MEDKYRQARRSLDRGDVVLHRLLHLLERAHVNLAHALKLNTVAEGVETEEQLRQLQSLGCDEMQGYLFGKPVPVESFEQKYLSSPRGA